MKKILSIIIGLTTVLSLGFTIAFSDQSSSGSESNINNEVLELSNGENEKIGFLNGIEDVPTPITDEQQILDAKKQNLSSAQISQIQQKLNNVMPTNHIVPYATWYYLASSYTVYIQQRPTWCMAACAQSTLKYLTGSAPIQKDAATDIGIVSGSGDELYSLRKYYNDMQKVNGYVYKSNTTSKGEMLSNMYLGITYYDAPITAGIVVNDPNGEWPYTTPGHATIVSGIKSDNLFVQLADPGVQYWNPNLNPYFIVSTDELYKAVSYSTKCGYLY